MKAYLSSKSPVGKLWVGNLAVTLEGTFDAAGNPAEISQEDFDRLNEPYVLEALGTLEETAPTVELGDLENQEIAQ